MVSFYVEIESYKAWLREIWDRWWSLQSPAGITQINNTESEGRRVLAQHCVLPSLAWGNWSGRCELYSDGRSVPPSLSVRTACSVGPCRQPSQSIPPALSVRTACPVGQYRLPWHGKFLAILATTAANHRHWNQTFQAGVSTLVDPCLLPHQSWIFSTFYGG